MREHTAKKPALDCRSGLVCRGTEFPMGYRGTWLLWGAKIQINVSSKVVERSVSHLDSNFFQTPFSFCMENKLLIKR